MTDNNKEINKEVDIYRDTLLRYLGKFLMNNHQLT